jgi:hypothetical protein
VQAVLDKVAAKSKTHIPVMRVFTSGRLGSSISLDAISSGEGIGVGV